MDALEERVRLLAEGAAGRRRRPFRLGASFSPDRRSVDVLHVEGVLLVRAPDLARVQRRCEELGAVHRAAPARLPGIVELEVEADVHPMLDRMDDLIGERAVSLCHVACLTGFLAPGPAAWPTPVASEVAPPWPGPHEGAAAARVVLLDTGLLPDADREHPWLTGVTGDPDLDDRAPGALGPFQGHGTLLAGVIRSLGGPSTSVHVTATFEGGVVDEVTLAADLLEAVRRGVDVVTVPGGLHSLLGLPPLTSEVVRAALGDAGTARPLVLAAAGNDGSAAQLWPAASDEVVSVGALERDGHRTAAWSNYGAVDVWAVGEDVVGPFGSGSYTPPGETEARKFASPAAMSGTSLAAAVATGCVCAELAASGGEAVAAYRTLVQRSTPLPGLGPVLDPAQVGRAPVVLPPPEEVHLGFEPVLEEAPPPRMSAPPPWSAPPPAASPSPPAAPPAEVGGRRAAPSGGFELIEGPDASPASPPASPPTAFPRVDAPDEVLVGREFEVLLGLAPVASEGVAGGPVPLPADRVELDVQLIAEGFSLREGESWRSTLSVSPDDPFPVVALHLTAAPQDRPVRARQLQVTYAAAGSTLSWAARSIAVVADEARLGDTGIIPQSSGTVISVAPAELAPDLTVNIALGDLPGQLLWTFTSPLVDVPDAAVPTSLGGAPASFTRGLVAQVKQREGRADMQPYLRGVGAQIAGSAPQELWELLRQVAGRTAPAPPAVLLQSEDPFVPWELATLDPPLDPDRPPHLGCQAVVGRWVVTRRPRPAVPPPLELPDGDMTVICGSYTGPVWGRLEAAEQEAAELQSRYGARPVEARLPEVLGCLARQPAPQVLHFAGHGSVDDSGLENGLVLTDGTTLAPEVVMGTPLHGAPFVYLNACQVGAGQASLGSYAGMAAAFLTSGASAVVAPLWDVSDTVARELVLEFYDRCTRGEAPAEVVRDLRSRRTAPVDGAAGTGTTVATALAYQFFGHPRMHLWRAAPQPDLDPTAGGVT